MNSISILIKPSSSSCNLKCSYCFYHDEGDNREVKSYGFMNYDISHKIIDTALKDYDTIYFTFQGGEPTLIGLPFYVDFIKYANSIKGDKKIYYSMQTNGILLDDDFVSFFKENNFLIGISIDCSKIHDKYRGLGTYSKVLDSIKLLQKYKVDFTALSVINDEVSSYGEELYSELKKLGIYVHQYIPCLGDIKGEFDYLSPENYLKFLRDAFSKWIVDAYSDKPVSIRYFDNITMISMGLHPEMCGLLGHCNMQMAVESNGNIYPCDFYALDEYLIGNIKDMDFREILAKGASFNERTKVDGECLECPAFKYCMGGCYREDKKYCYTYKEFIKYSIKKIEKLGKKLKEE